MWNVKYVIGGFPNCTDKCCYYNYFRVNILFQSIFYLSIARANSSSLPQTQDTDCGLKEEMNLTELQLGDTAGHNQLQLDNDTNQLFGVEIAMGAWWVVISVSIIPFKLLPLPVLFLHFSNLSMASNMIVLAWISKILLNHREIL